MVIFTIDPDINIMSCLAISDVLVSDESNCLVEALLFDVPGIAVSDWQIPAISNWDPPLAPRLPDPPKSAIRTTRYGLGNTVEEVLKNRNKLRPTIRQYRDHYFSHIGISSELVVSVIESAITGSYWPVEPLLPRKGYNIN